LIEMQGHSEEQREDLVEQVAREIQLRGLTVPAVLFLQASRPYRPLGSSAMVFFDPTLRRVFGGELPVATEILADDLGIEQLIERLQDFLLELGRGFCFEARQKRILIGGEHFFVDMVFYHWILKCLRNINTNL